MPGLGLDTLYPPSTPPFIKKECVSVAIQYYGMILWVDHGFDQNNWDICQNKVVIFLRINVEPLPILVPVVTGLYSPPFPSVTCAGHDSLNNLVGIILRQLWKIFHNFIGRP